MADKIKDDFGTNMADEDNFLKYIFLCHTKQGIK